MKFGQLIDITRQIFFLENHAENKAGTLVPDPFLFFEKALHKIKSKGLQTGFKFPQNLGLLISRDMLNFGFFKKNLRIISSPHFACGFSTKMFLMLYSID